LEQILSDEGTIIAPREHSAAESAIIICFGWLLVLLLLSSYLSTGGVVMEFFCGLKHVRRYREGVMSKILPAILEEMCGVNNTILFCKKRSYHIVLIFICLPIYFTCPLLMKESTHNGKVDLHPTLLK
jgi:hypothetical protein